MLRPFNQTADINNANESMLVRDNGQRTPINGAGSLMEQEIYTTTFNYPNSQASTSLTSGGNGQSSLTGTSQSYGLKLSLAW
jgi:hypothetical protein